MNWRMSLLVISEFLGLFINTLTAEDKHFLCNGENSPQPIQIQLSKRQKTFSQFFTEFLKFIFSFKYFEEMTIIAYVLPKLKTAKVLVRPLFKKWRFITPFDSQHVKGSKALVKSTWQHFYGMFSSLWENLTWKMCVLVICETSGLFVNRLVADGKYSLRISKNFLEQIQMQLPKKQKKFLNSLIHFWNLHQILNIFVKIEDPHSLYISQIRECKKSG